MSAIADELRQRTFRYFLQILSFCKALPDTWEAREIGRQLLRAGMGVTGNYWSACRARSSREFIAKLGVAVDEAEEAVLWMTAIVQGDIRTGLQVKALLQEGTEIRAVLSRSHKTARENRPQKNRQPKLTNSPTHQPANFSGGLP